MLDEPAIDALLKERYRRRDPDEDPERIEQVAFAASGAADGEGRARAVEALRRDPLLAEAVMRLGGLPLPKKHGATWRPLLAIAAALLIALLLLDPLARDRAELTPMGSSDRFSVGVERAGRRFLIAPGGLLERGDRIGLFYSTELSGTHLAALHRDGAGAVTVLFPLSERTSSVVDPAIDRPLPDGAVAEEGSGCEWFVAVFSERPLPLDRIERAIAEAETHACDLELGEVDGARTIRIVPVKR